MRTLKPSPCQRCSRDGSEERTTALRALLLTSLFPPPVRKKAGGPALLPTSLSSTLLGSVPPAREVWERMRTLKPKSPSKQKFARATPHFPPATSRSPDAGTTNRETRLQLCILWTHHRTSFALHGQQTSCRHLVTGSTSTPSKTFQPNKAAETISHREAQKGSQLR